MDILSEALKISKLLAKANLKWTFVGGVAVGIHGLIRATEDIDIVINPNDLKKLDALLIKNNFVINPQPMKFKDGFVLHRRVKIVGKEYFVLDIMIPPDNFPELLKNRQAGLISGTKVYVAAKPDLIRMKRGTGRLKDRLDAENLEGKNDRP